MVTKRCSPSAAASSTVIASGSLSTPSPSDSETPCFLRLTASFFGSKSEVTWLLYALYAYPSNAARFAGTPPHSVKRGIIYCYLCSSVFICGFILAFLGVLGGSIFVGDFSLCSLCSLWLLVFSPRRADRSPPAPRQS